MSKPLSGDPALERAHELLEKHWPEQPRVLWLNPPGALARHVPENHWRYWQPHFPEHAALRAANWKELESEQPAQWECVVLYASKHKEENWHLLEAANSLLAEGGQILFVVPNDYGSKSYQKGLEQAMVGYQSARKSRLYQLRRGPVAGSPTLERPRRNGDGYWSCPGLFSWAAVDTGSRVLVEAMRGEKLKGPVADLGAGWGYLAHQLVAPKTPVHLFESDRRALACASANLEGRRFRAHWCDLSDNESWPDDAPTSFASVITNPPFHSGQREQASLGQLFARLAHRLLPRGQALWLVGNTHLAYPRLLAGLFSSVEVRAQKEGFTVVKAVK